MRTLTKICGISLFFAVALTADYSAQAADATWVGATDTTWTSSADDSFSPAYSDPNTVEFNDTGVGTVVLGETVAPGSVLVSNSAVDYAFSGNGIGGTGALTKDGSGILTLSGTNTFTGGIVLRGGTLRCSIDENLGDSANTIIFTNGTSTLQADNTYVTVGANHTINIASGSRAILRVKHMNANPRWLKIMGPITGGGDVQTFNSYVLGSAEVHLLSTSNDFTGQLILGPQGSTGNNNFENFIASLADGPGYGNIVFGQGQNSGAFLQFIWDASATNALELNHRQFELSHTEGSYRVYNNNSDSANTVTVNTDLLITGVGAKTFGLGGVNTGTNTFAGNITNGVSSVISLSKYGTGKWILSGTNTYSGNTTITDGTLEVRGAGQLGGGTYAGNISNTDTTPGAFTFDSSANQVISGVISGGMELIKDGSGTLSLTGSNTYTGNTTVNAGTLSLGDGTSNSSLDDFSTLSVASGAVLNLNYAGTDKVFFLNLGGSPAAAGTWGATGSGATHIDDAYFTGTGVVENLAGSTVALGIAYWDGGSTDIGTDGNAASAGGAGTWDTTTLNWDVGFTAHAAWLNTTNDKAIFAGAENADRTVTVTGALNIKELSFETTGSAGTRYNIDGGTLNFGTGGLIRVSDNRYDQTITSAITGSPEVRTKDYGAGNTYKGLKFAPTNGTVTLGAVLNPDNSGTTDKAGITLAGTTTGNTVASIDYVSGDKYGDVNVQGGEWTVDGGIRTGTIRISGGKLIVNGTVTCDYNGIVMSGDGTFSGSNTVYRDDRRTKYDFVSGTSIAPGDGIGTITFDWGTSGAPTADQWLTAFRAGSTYEWEVGPNTNDIVHIVDGRLIAEGFTLKIIDAGGTPKAADQLPVFTYGTLDSKTLSLGAVVIDMSALPGSWSGTPSLVDDNSGTIYLTGLQAPIGGTVFIFK